MRLSLCSLLPLVLLVAGIAAGPATAAPSISATTKVYDIKIRGRHAVNWVYASSLDRKDCSTWSQGNGRLEIEFRIAGRARYQLTEIRKDGRLSELQWGVTRYKPLEAAITQNGTWKHNNGFRMACTPCGQLSEYGPCVPDPPLPPAPVCKRRFADGVIDTKIFREVRRAKQLADVKPPRLHGPGLLVEMRYVDTDKEAIAGCYPFAGGQAQPLPQPAALVLGVHVVRTLERGETVSVAEQRHEWMKSDVLQDGSRCFSLSGQLKMNACAGTEVILDVERVR